jgi:hypothetical protein
MKTYIHTYTQITHTHTTYRIESSLHYTNTIHVCKYAYMHTYIQITHTQTTYCLESSLHDINGVIILQNTPCDVFMHASPCTKASTKMTKEFAAKDTQTKKNFRGRGKMLSGRYMCGCVKVVYCVYVE